ncbi:hypothetical protein BDBG_16993 [Blastomyces gilchristii SLH14081]|uniref:Uncharacterized protein n=1 Tax=Blastomyces gilchristii (strain SLH14081) TaxID=559298 RepID=A0A179UM82_BLAGS|nr:uncharacterized protein BDBG_16993 [Blastomyces gilchristii SLH14081]OAT08329.1 hypothetical protein BDBG_16993 [Blastomyces gilchristii SLH14081]
MCRLLCMKRAKKKKKKKSHSWVDTNNNSFLCTGNKNTKPPLGDKRDEMRDCLKQRASLLFGQHRQCRQTMPGRLMLRGFYRPCFNKTPSLISQVISPFISQRLFLT